MADFRFTPSTAAVTLPYWIDDNTTTPKGFWVRVSTLPAGSNSIYLYYGDYSAGPFQNWDTTFSTFGAYAQELSAISGTRGLWHMNNNWADSSGYGNNGTAYNGATFTTSARLGSHSGSFDGINDYVDGGTGASLSVSNPMTIEAWVKINAYSPDNNTGQIIAGSYSGGVGYIFSLIGPDCAKLHLRFPSGSTADPNSLLLNTWYHVAGTYNGTQSKVYVNGRLVGTGNGGTSDAARMVIGKASWFDGVYFSGLIDELRLLNIALTSSDIMISAGARKYAPTEPTISSVGSEESAFFSTGTYKSPVIDAASKVVVSSISWNPSGQLAGTNLAVGIRVSSYPFSIDSSTPSWLTVSNGQTLNWHGRYIQYQSTFTTTNSTTTPRLEDISITYRVKPWQEKSVTRTPPNSFGFGGGENWVWKIPVKGGQLVTISAYIRYNTEYLGGTYDKPKLTLSGLGINESISATSSAENSWELRQLSGTPSSDGILTLKADGFSPNSGGKFYIDDINVSQ